MPLTTRPMRPADIPAVSRLLADQIERRHARDPRLSYPRSPLRAAESVIRFDLQMAEGKAMLAEEGGMLVGYFSAHLQTLDPDNVERMWLPNRYLTSELLLQAAVAAPYAWESVFPLLWAAVDAVAEERDLPWVLALVPAVAELDSLLAGLGFRHTSDFAYRPLAEPPLDFTPLPGVHIRRALMDDQEAIIDLFEELVTYHVANDPDADRMHPLVLRDFERMITTLDPRRWQLVVAEEAQPGGVPGALLGFGLGSIELEESSPTYINMMPVGRVGFIHEFAVTTRARGRGIGRALHAALALALAARSKGQPMHGLWLIYRTTNPTSSRFWPALGYKPLYQMWRRGGWE
jgi:GNAT superfamily N-acetyltransferase